MKDDKVWRQRRAHGWNLLFDSWHFIAIIGLVWLLQIHLGVFLARAVPLQLPLGIHSHLPSTMKIWKVMWYAHGDWFHDQAPIAQDKTHSGLSSLGKSISSSTDVSIYFELLDEWWQWGKLGVTALLDQSWEFTNFLTAIWAPFFILGFMKFVAFTRSQSNDNTVRPVSSISDEALPPNACMLRNCIESRNQMKLRGWKTMVLQSCSESLIKPSPCSSNQNSIENNNNHK